MRHRWLIIAGIKSPRPLRCLLQLHEGHETQTLFILNAHWGFVQNTGRLCGSGFSYGCLHVCLYVHEAVLTKLDIKEKEPDWDCLSLSEDPSFSLFPFRTINSQNVWIVKGRIIDIRHTNINNTCFYQLCAKYAS